jgi:hypothetical protein
MTESDGSSQGRNIVIALIGLVGTIITTIGIIASGILGGGGGNAGPTPNPPAEPEEVSYTIEVPPNTNIPAEIVVTLDGQEVGHIYTHQEPHGLTETTSPGQPSYTLTATSFGGSSCPTGQAVSGGGSISISDGDNFAFFAAADCSRIWLNELH